tara:strand:+ start:265 stop:975 length:711 start_codon:yes stop_codon:yes gene_type:complete
MKLGLGLNIKTSGGAWTPKNLSGLQAWFKFDTGLEESDTTTPENGENITKWTDQSGNANDLTTPDNYFVYNSTFGAVESEDTQNDKLNLDTQLNFSGQFAMYIRVAVSTLSAGAYDLFFYDKDSASADFIRVQSTTEVRLKISNGTVRKWAQGTQTLDQFYNYGFERDGSNNLTAYRDGSALSATTVVSDTGTFDIDAIGQNFDGMIKEIIICNSGLSASDRTNLQTYLAKLTQGE